MGRVAQWTLGLGRCMWGLRYFDLRVGRGVGVDNAEVGTCTLTGMQCGTWTHRGLVDSLVRVQFDRGRTNVDAYVIGVLP